LNSVVAASSIRCFSTRDLNSSTNIIVSTVIKVSYCLVFSVPMMRISVYFNLAVLIS